MRFVANIAYAALLGVFVSGCSLTFPAQKQRAMPLTNQNRALDCSDHGSALAVKKEIVCETNAYSIEEFLFTFRNTESKKNNSVAGEFWRSKSSDVKNRRLAVLIPGTGDRVSTEGSSKPLVASGFDVVRFFSGIDIFDKNGLIKKETLTEAELRLFVKAGGDVIRLRACDYIFIINYFDNPPHAAIGISGVSLGGIFTPILAGSSLKAQSALVMISGGNIAEILRTSQEKDIVEIRTMVQKKFVGSEERLWEILREKLWSIDPLRFSLRLDPSKMRIIANYWDYVVRYEFALQLWEASGKPDFEVILFPPGHYGSVLLLWIPMIRYELRCLMWPFCVPVPWSVGRVPEINRQFFKEKLPR